MHWYSTNRPTLDPLRQRLSKYPGAPLWSATAISSTASLAAAHDEITAEAQRLTLELRREEIKAV